MGPHHPVPSAFMPVMSSWGVTAGGIPYSIVQIDIDNAQEGSAKSDKHQGFRSKRAKHFHDLAMR